MARPPADPRHLRRRGVRGHRPRPGALRRAPGRRRRRRLPARGHAQLLHDLVQRRGRRVRDAAAPASAARRARRARAAPRRAAHDHRDGDRLPGAAGTHGRRRRLVPAHRPDPPRGDPGAHGARVAPGRPARMGLGAAGAARARRAAGLDRVDAGAGCGGRRLPLRLRERPDARVRVGGPHARPHPRLRTGRHEPLLGARPAARRRRAAPSRRATPARRAPGSGGPGGGGSRLSAVGPSRPGPAAGGPAGDEGHVATPCCAACDRGRMGPGAGGVATTPAHLGHGDEGPRRLP